MQVSTELIIQLQAKQERVRNMCILAHVDHGKTTLSDHLIGSNGLIHPRLMGELRYLDSLEDEQVRGITMKASSISLLFVPGAATGPQGPAGVADVDKLERGYLFNLIDSPGHVDFCSEVSTAARLSDGALVVVDAVEGVCIQTHAVLRQAWEEKVRPCLFINKMDRLITELKLTPAEAYTRLSSIVTHCNMIMSAFHSEQYMSEADAVLAHEDAKEAAAVEAGGERQEGDEAGGQQPLEEALHAEQEEEDAFSPARCDVAFGSAHDGWAFRLDQFAAMYAQKLGCKPESLTNALWGDWAISPKEKRVVRIKRKGAAAIKAKPLFVQLVLETVYKAYSACEAGEDAAAVLGPIVKARNLGHLVPAKALEHPDPKQALRAVMRAWLPLSEAVLGMAVAHLPSPPSAAPLRMPRLLGSPLGSQPHLAPPQAQPSPSLAATLRECEAHLAASSASPEAPVLVYVSKMIAVPATLLPRTPGGPLPTSAPGSNGEVFLAFGRVFSGVIRDGMTIHVLSPAYTPAVPDSVHRTTAVVNGLYLMMGRALERLQAVPAGSVLAMGGLDAAILKSATLSSTPMARPLAPMTFQAAPIVKVAVEPALPSDMPRLVEGLRLLNRADPFVEVSVMESGEHVLGAAGEVHLETCIKDLKTRFARVELQVSPPLVAFRESVLCPSEAADASAGGHTALATATSRSAATRVVEAATPNGVLLVRVRASPLPAALASALGDSPDLVKRAVEGVMTERHSTAAAATDDDEQGREALGRDAASTGEGVQGDTHMVGQGAGGGVAGGLQANKGGPRGAVAVDGADLGVVVDSQVELGVGVVAAHREGRGGATAGSELEVLRSKVRAAAKEAGAKTEAIVARAWQLGPRGMGPCMLLTPQAPVEGQASRALGGGSGGGGGCGASRLAGQPDGCAQGGSAGGGAGAHSGTACGSLFDPAAVPGVVRVGRQGVVMGMAAGGGGGRQGWAATAATGLGQADGGAVGVSASALPDALPQGPQQEGQQQQQQQQQCVVDLRLGWPLAATALGLLEPSTAACARHWGSGGAAAVVSGQLPASWEPVAAAVESGAVAGFQWATSAGPLCEEPMWGVAFELDARLVLPACAVQVAGHAVPAQASGQQDGGSLGGAAVEPEEGQQQQQQPQDGFEPSPVLAELQEDVYGPFSGQVMTAVATACRRAVLEADPRIVEAMYLCQVQTTAEALSGTYAVLGRRRARILREEMREGSDTFLVHAYLPVEASFGLADEMRRRSSGAASASLLLSHWERLQVDPFFVPTTEEEREEHGEEGVGGHAVNVARKLMDAVRRRKGLAVEEKVVKVATKQRTLKRNV